MDQTLSSTSFLIRELERRHFLPLLRDLKGGVEGREILHQKLGGGMGLGWRWIFDPGWGGGTSFLSVRWVGFVGVGQPRGE